MSANRPSEAPLATRDAPKEPWRDADWQKLWLLLKARSWTSLAIVPAGAGAPEDFAMTIAVTLARIGILHLGTPIHVADATNIPLAHLEQFTEEVERLNREGDLVIIALSTVDASPVTVSLARKASFALLCILLEVMSSAETKRTVERVGRSSFMGSAIFHPAGMAAVDKAVNKAGGARKDP